MCNNGQGPRLCAVIFHCFGESSPLSCSADRIGLKKKEKIVQIDHGEKKLKEHQASPVPDRGYLQYKAIWVFFKLRVFNLFFFNISKAPW